MLPPPSQRADICCMDLTAHFLVTGTRSGLISCHTVAQQPVAVNEYRHEGGGILRLFAQPGGTRLVFQDEQQAVMMLNQVRRCLGWQQCVQWQQWVRPVLLTLPSCARSMCDRLVHAAGCSRLPLFCPCRRLSLICISPPCR